MKQLNPQLIIDELSRRVQQLTLENVILSAELTELTNRETEETTIIGDDIEE